MNNLDNQDLWWALKRLPTILKETMNKPEWHNKIFVGGGFLRSIVAGESINDIDVFVPSKEDAKNLSEILKGKKGVFITDNAYTVKGRLPIQMIHRWVFNSIEEVSNSFDFTICCAAFTKTKDGYVSYVDDRFYKDLASKRLVYRYPVRNEDAGGSMLRVLKYYQKGYRIPLDSLGGVMARMIQGVRIEKRERMTEDDWAKILTGLLREVDPNVDPTHISHLPTIPESVKETNIEDVELL